jgi:hypothetical protein
MDSVQVNEKEITTVSKEINNLESEIESKLVLEKNGSKFNSTESLSTSDSNKDISTSNELLNFDEKQKKKYDKLVCK